MPLTLESLGDKLKTTARDAALQIGTDAAVAMAGKYALELEGPLGILISEAATLAIGAFEKKLGKTQYKPGQWVFIDVGSQTHHINEKPKIIEIASQAIGSLWGLGDNDEFAIVPEELDLTATPAEHAIGFFLGVDKDSDYLNDCFNYKTGQIERIHDDKLRPCPESLAKKLDESEFSTVREVLFMKEHDPTLKSYLPTDPGDKVIMDGKTYCLLRQAGDEFVLEDQEDGKEILVHSSEIIGGKVDNNTSWDHAKLHIGSFSQRANDALFRGEWVWIPKGDLLEKIESKFHRRLLKAPDILAKMGPNDKVLGLVESIEGDKVNVVRAYDGSKFQYPQSNVYGTSSALNYTLVRQKSTKNWRQAVLRGFDPSVNPLSVSHPYLALGIGEEIPEMPRDATMYPTARVTQSGTEDDMTNSFKAKVGKLNVNDQLVGMQDKLDDEAQLHKYAQQYTVETDNTPESSSSGGSGASFLIILAGAALIFSLA